MRPETGGRASGSVRLAWPAFGLVAASLSAQPLALVVTAEQLQWNTGLAFSNSWRAMLFPPYANSARMRQGSKSQQIMKVPFDYRSYAVPAVAGRATLRSHSRGSPPIWIREWLLDPNEEIDLDVVKGAAPYEESAQIHQFPTQTTAHPAELEPSNVCSCQR